MKTEFYFTFSKMVLCYVAAQKQTTQIFIHAFKNQSNVFEVQKKTRIPIILAPFLIALNNTIIHQWEAQSRNTIKRIIQ
jgi:hypothetical protein